MQFTYRPIVPMSNLSLPLTQDLLKDPFKVLFYKALEMHEITCLSDRVEFIDGLTYGLGEVESTAKGQKETGTFCGIASAFSAAAVVGAYALIPFPLNAALSLFSVGCAITGVSESVRRVTVMSPMAEEIERHRLALYSTESINWACLWEYCCSGEGNGDEIFRSVLFKASRGSIQGDRLILFGNAKEPFIAAIKALANKQGRTPDDVAAFVRCIKAAFEQRQVKPAIGNWEADLQLPETPTMRRDIGVNTRFAEPGNGGAIDVPPQSTVSPTSVEMPQSIPVTPTQQYQTPPPRQRETALDALLASPYISRALFGAQRTGKSYLAAVASRKLSEQGTKTYHLNLASFGTEDDEYWVHATKSVRGDLPSMSNPDDAVNLIEAAIAAVEEWFTQPDSVLIVDELAYLGSSSNAYSELLKPLLKIIADKIACLSSTGIKRRQAIWTIAPEFVAGGLTQDARAVKKLQLCYVSIAPNRSVDWNGSRIGFNGELFEQIKNNFPIEYPPVMGLNSDRICFVNNKWLPVGELPRLGNPPSSGSSGSPSPAPNQPLSPMASMIIQEMEGGEPKKS